MSEQHRYFPDWTLRSLTSGPDIEADDNSYLAGGYAEEFGYRARISYSPTVAELDGDVPELCREQRSQASPVHPGYPFKAQPVAGELDIKRDEPGMAAVARGGGLADRFPYQGAVERAGTFVVVSSRSRIRDHVGALPRAKIASIRLASALVAMRWALRRR
jgi:hypothetical protein